jgi:tetratricopeptide (TPR) repeat protein
MGRFDEAIENYEKAIELDDTRCYPYFNIVLALFESGNHEAGMARLTQVLASGKEKDWGKQVSVCASEINVALLKRAPLATLPELIGHERRVFAESSYTEAFSEGMIGAITELLKTHRDIPLERMEELRVKLIPELAKEEDLSVVCRLFDTGIRYLATKNVRVLLELPLEERTTLERMLGVKA